MPVCSFNFLLKTVRLPQECCPRFSGTLSGISRNAVRDPQDLPADCILILTQSNLLVKNFSFYSFNFDSILFFVIMNVIKIFGTE